MNDSPPNPPLVADVVEAWAPTGGGIRSYVQAKADLWVRTGRARHLLVVPGPRNRVFRSGPSTVVEIGGPPIPGCTPYRFLLNQRRLRETLETFRPDVVELGSQYLAGATALSYREGSGALVSSFFHTDVPGAYVAPVGRRYVGSTLANFAAERMRQRFVELGRRADLTVVSSPAHLEALRALGVPHLHSLPLGVDLDVFRPEAANGSLVSTPLESQVECQFVFVGRLDREKRVPMLLEAFRKARAMGAQCRLLIIGEGPLSPEVRAAAEASGGWLAHHPFETDRRRLAGLLAASDVYVTVGPFETFGLSVLEAQACGLPVLGVRAGALRDRVPDGSGAGWLVPPDDVDALSGEILRVAQLSPAVRMSAGAAARELALRSGGWEDRLASLAERYRLPAPKFGHEPLDLTGITSPLEPAAAHVP